MRKVECCFNCERYYKETCFPTEYGYDKFEVAPDDICKDYICGILSSYFEED